MIHETLKKYHCANLFFFYNKQLFSQNLCELIAQMELDQVVLASKTRNFHRLKNQRNSTRDWLIVNSVKFMSGLELMTARNFLFDKFFSLPHQSYIRQIEKVWMSFDIYADEEK